MGAWGTSLYSNDTAQDVKDDFMELLRAGNSKEAATEIILKQYHDILNIEEEAPLFWYALADTQWDRGMLLPEVKETALHYLEMKEIEAQRWEDTSKAFAKQWEKTLMRLRTKLEQPQPAEKKTRKRRLFHCPWALGDYYAYRLSSNLSREKGLCGKYIVWRKISEQFWYPGHMIPVVKIYAKVWESPPSLSELSNCSLLPAMPLTDPKKNYYYWGLISQKEKEIPIDQLTWLGNESGPDLTPNYNNRSLWFTSSFTVGWQNSKWNDQIENEFIEVFLWLPKDYDYLTYAEKKLQIEQSRSIANQGL